MSDQLSQKEFVYKGTPLEQRIRVTYTAPGYYKAKPGNAGFVRMAAKCQRNEPCPCGSGAKFKHCCKTEDNMLAMAHAAANEAKRQQEQSETV